MRLTAAPLLAIAALHGLPTPTNAKAVTKPPTCLFVTVFFYTLPNCVFEVNAGPVDPGALLSQGKSLDATDIGQCMAVVSTTAAMSYNFFYNGNANGCTITTYNAPNCPSGSGKALPVAGNAFQCKKASLLTGVKSFKLSC